MLSDYIYHKAYIVGAPHHLRTPHSVLVGGVHGATARGALGWYRPSVGVPRDVGCGVHVVSVAYIFSVQFSSAWLARD